jgi:hypothetical protein
MMTEPPLSRLKHAEELLTVADKCRQPDMAKALRAMAYRDIESACELGSAFKPSAPEPRPDPLAAPSVPPTRETDAGALVIENQQLRELVLELSRLVLKQLGDKTASS